MAVKNLKDFVIINNELYHQGGGRVPRQKKNCMENMKFHVAGITSA